MPEPRWRDVAANGECSHCGATHYGTGPECPYREENMGESCAMCGERTNYCCADCRLDGAGAVYICIKDACRTEHEKKHPKPQLGFPVIKVVGHVVNHMEWKDGAIILEVT